MRLTSSYCKITNCLIAMVGERARVKLVQEVSVNFNTPLFQQLAILVKNCLEMATKHKYDSIAFPPFDIGDNEFLLESTPKIVLQSIDAFFDTYPDTCLKIVEIVVRPEDSHIVKASFNC